MLDLEKSLLSMIRESSLNDFIVPTSSPPPEADLEESEPISAAMLGGSLKNLEHFLIQGDIRRCVICNSEYADVDINGNGGNLPRVLYCGDCICEACIVK